MGGSQFQLVEKRRPRSPISAAVDMRIRPLLEQMLQPDPANRTGNDGGDCELADRIVESASSKSAGSRRDSRRSPERHTMPKPNSPLALVDSRCRHSRGADRAGGLCVLCPGLVGTGYRQATAAAGNFGQKSQDALRERERQHRRMRRSLGSPAGIELSQREA